jgi:endonuclease YncB( thermonuclease family)
MYSAYVLLLLFVSFSISAKTTYPNIIGTAISVRVRGIDTPEMRVKCSSEKAKAIQARDYLRVILARGEVIELHNVERGKFFCIVANVIVDGVAIAELIFNIN